MCFLYLSCENTWPHGGSSAEPEPLGALDMGQGPPGPGPGSRTCRTSHMRRTSRTHRTCAARYTYVIPRISG